MTLDTFRSTLKNETPPKGLPVTLEALWYAGKDNWNKAHDLVQDFASGDGAWIHAYLHRVEGDLGNAAYWYRRAGKPVANDTLEQEWERIVKELLS